MKVKVLFKKYKKHLALLCLVGLFGIIGLHYWMGIQYENDVLTNPQDVPDMQAALILGAKVYKNGNLSKMMQDRADAGIKLYQLCKVKKLLISGDHSKSHYDETNTIRNYMLKKGIPIQDVFMDHAGFDTQSSLYRAKQVFKAKSLIIVTQDFHLPRALYFANLYHIPSKGLLCTSTQYGDISLTLCKLREYPARVKALMEGVLHFRPHFIGNPYPLTGDGRSTEDGK
jgi:SanA protein